MKNSVFSFLILFFCHWANAQFTISGSIYNSGRQPLAGANIVIENTGKGAASDNFGKFLIPDIQSGNYMLKITFIGYEPYQKKLVVKSDIELSVVMKETSEIASEVIISAVRADISTPVTYSDVNKTEIKQMNNVADVPYILSMIPSVVVSSDAGNGVGYTSFRIRGTDMNRINVTINGVPFNDAESHAVYWVDIPDIASSVHQIQVQRGVGTSTNGAGAFGASINLNSLQLNPNPYSEFSGYYGSFNTSKTIVSAGTGLMGDRFAFDVRLTGIHSDGFVDRSASELKSGYFSAGYHTEKTNLKLIASIGHEVTGQAWNGVPKCKLKNDTAAMQKLIADDEWSLTESENLFQSSPRTFNRYLYKNQVDNYQQAHYQAIYSIKVNNNLYINNTLHYTKGIGFYESYRYNRKFSKYGLRNIVVGGDTIRKSDFIDRKWLDNDFYGFILNLKYSTEKIEIIAGIAVNQYYGWHFGKILWAQINDGSVLPDTEWYRSRGIKNDLSSFIRFTLKTGEKFSLFADMQLRYITHSIKGKDDKTTNDGLLRNLNYNIDALFPNPKLGLMYSLNQLSQLYCSVSVAHREPNRNNIVDADPVKPLPRSERLTDYEAGYRFNDKNYNLNMNVYYMDYKDQLVLSGEINDVGYPVMTNVPYSYRFGYELAGDYKISDYFELKANMTLSTNKIKKYISYIDNWDTWGQDSVVLKNKDLSFSPSVTAGAEVLVHPLSDFSVAFISNYVGKQYIDNTSDKSRMLNAYLVNTLRFNYEYQFPKMGIAAFFIINNLFNVEYESNAWVYRYIYENEERVMDGYFPQAGRNFTTGLTFRF